VASKRANYGMTVIGSESCPQQQGFLNELLGKTSNRLEMVEDEGRKRAQQIRLTRAKRRESGGSEVDSIDRSLKFPQYECPRCHQLIYEFDRSSHSTSHSSEILPFLYLGGERNASNKTELTLRTHITHILNVAWEVANFYPDLFIYQNYSISDYSDQNISEILDDAVLFIESARMSGGRCLVHCVQGISRSATVVIAYLIASEGWSVQTALQFVKERRSLIAPNPGFLQQLQEYEIEWKRRRQQLNLNFNQWKQLELQQLAQPQQQLNNNCRGDQLTPPDPFPLTQAASFSTQSPDLQLCAKLPTASRQLSVDCPTLSVTDSCRATTALDVQ